MAAEDPNVEIGMLMNNTMMVVKGAGIMVLKLIQYLIALKKQQRLTQAQYDNIIQFAKDTEGDFTIANIPTQDPEKIAQFHEALRSGGVAYCDLPDLDVGDGLTQVAIRNQDFARFQYIYEEFSKSQLSGGMKEYIELKNNTSGNLTLHNIPIGSNYGKIASIGETTANLMVTHKDNPMVVRFVSAHPEFRNKDRNQIKQMVMDSYLAPEGDVEKTKGFLRLFSMDRIQDAGTVAAADQALKYSEEVQGSSHFADFRDFIQRLKEQRVSFAIMPDLNIRDEYTQIAVANIHEGRFKEALTGFLREGESASSISMDDYYKTGCMNPEEYTETASKDIQKSVEEAKTAVRRRKSKELDPENTYQHVKSTLEKQASNEKYDYYAKQALDDSPLKEIHFTKEEIHSFNFANETVQIYYPGTDTFFQMSPAVTLPGTDGDVACFFDMTAEHGIKEFGKEIDPVTGNERMVEKDVSVKEALMKYRDKLAEKQYAPFEGAWTVRIKGAEKTVDTAKETVEKTAEIAGKVVEKTTTAAMISPNGAAVKTAETAGEIAVKAYDAFKPEKGVAP